MTLPTITDTINTYLYGDTSPPSIDISGDSSLARSTNPTMNINVNDFMDDVSGPGRFAVPAQFALVQGFFNAAPGTFTTGTYSKAEVMAALGLSDTWTMHQYNWKDGTDDYTARTFIYNSQQYQLGSDTEFVVSAGGDKSLSSVSIAPQAEKFDFVSNDGYAAIANPLLNAIIDPAGIGRTVDINYTGTVTPISSYTQGDFNTDSGTTIPSWHTSIDISKLLTEGTDIFHSTLDGITIAAAGGMHDLLTAADSALQAADGDLSQFLQSMAPPWGPASAGFTSASARENGWPGPWSEFGRKRRHHNLDHGHQTT